jgi:hypothetical protein
MERERGVLEGGWKNWGYLKQKKILVERKERERETERGKGVVESWRNEEKVGREGVVLGISTQAGK